MRALLVGLVGLIGCDVDCASVSPTDCASEASCAVITARPLVDDGAGGACVDFDVDAEAVGCMDANLGCDDAITWADAPGGQRYWFPSSCIPGDFTAAAVETTDPVCP